MVVTHLSVQGILLAILVGTGAIASAEDAGNVQNLLICLEMLPASIAMFFAFPHTEYLEGGAISCTAFAAYDMSCRPACLSGMSCPDDNADTASAPVCAIDIPTTRAHPRLLKTRRPC